MLAVVVFTLILRMRKFPSPLIVIRVQADENGFMTGIRIDKWLWAARFFKTRMLAAKACDLGRIASNGTSAKASREIKPGDHLEITNEAGVFSIEVLAVTEARGSAAVAQQFYRESEASQALRHKVAEDRKANPPIGMGGVGSRAGKPSKRDRRLIHSFRGGA